MVLFSFSLIRSRRRGLTLVEMLGVALLVGMLAATASLGMVGVRNANNKKMADQRISLVINAAKAYYADQLKWPSQLSDLVATGSNGLQYLQEIPSDPYTEHTDNIQPLLYDSSTTRVWARGRNLQNDNGAGDDIARCANGSC